MVNTFLTILIDACFVVIITKWIEIILSLLLGAIPGVIIALYFFWRQNKINKQHLKRKDEILESLFMDIDEIKKICYHTYEESTNKKYINKGPRSRRKVNHNPDGNESAVIQILDLDLGSIVFGQNLHADAQVEYTAIDGTVELKKETPQCHTKIPNDQK